MKLTFVFPKHNSNSKTPIQQLHWQIWYPIEHIKENDDDDDDDDDDR